MADFGATRREMSDQLQALGGWLTFWSLKHWFGSGSMELKKFQKIYANHIIGGCSCPDYHRSTTLGLVRSLGRDDINTPCQLCSSLVGMPLTFSIADSLTMKLVSCSALTILRGRTADWDRPSTNDSLVKPRNQQICMAGNFSPTGVWPGTVQ